MKRVGKPIRDQRTIEASCAFRDLMYEISKTSTGRQPLRACADRFHTATLDLVRVIDEGGLAWKRIAIFGWVVAVVNLAVLIWVRWLR